MVISTGEGRVRRGPRSRCLTAITVAGLVFGSGLMTHSGAQAAGFSSGTVAFPGDERGRSAVIEQPVDLPAATTEVDKQTDTETLDAGAPPPATSTMTGPGGDVETLDQGSPPVAASAPPAVGAVSPPVGSVAGTYVAPASSPGEAPSYAAPSVTSGPAIPPGFGTGHVHVGAGVSEFPVGLVSCHVGTITGRAYVGVDCPNGDSVVGFAPSLNDFPFVLQADFPFEGDEGFLIDAARSEAAASDAGNNNVDVLASMPTAATDSSSTDSSTSEPQIGVSGASAEKSRTTAPTVETSTSDNTSEQSKSNKQSSGGSSSTRTQKANQDKDGGSGRAYSLAVRQLAHLHPRHQQDRGNANNRAGHGNGRGHVNQSSHHNDKGHNKNNSGGKNKSGDKNKSDGKKNHGGKK